MQYPIVGFAVEPGKNGVGHRLVVEQRLPRPRDQIFEFFSDVFGLEQITPPWLRFRVLGARPLHIRQGTLIDYRLRLRGIPLRWRSRITEWEPPLRFVDQQIRGPYRWWRHEHTFVDEGSTTLVRDVVDYGVPLQWLVHRWLVLPDLRRIFHFRRVKLAEMFDG